MLDGKIPGPRRPARAASDRMKGKRAENGEQRTENSENSEMRTTGAALSVADVFIAALGGVGDEIEF